MAAMILLSRLRRSFPLTIIFCFFVGGPEVEGVGGTADNGVGGWVIVAEAGVRLLIWDCLRAMFARGSGVLACMRTSSSSVKGVENSTVVKTLGPLAGPLCKDLLVWPEEVLFSLFAS